MTAARRGSASDLSDAAAFDAIARGDLGPLGVLFDRYHDAVRSVCLHAGVARSDVDDAVQDTFVRLASNAARYDGREIGKPWILGTAWRVAADRRRSVRRWLSALARLAQSSAPAPVVTPEEERLHAERREAFARRVSALPERMRAAFVLVEVHGLSCEEAARALEIPVATVWTRLHHARKRLLDEPQGGAP
jgi:RNA polymerase sigma-70 factor (ECF subfamily)